MAHDARLATCHLGAVYQGLIDHGVVITIGGTDRTSDGIQLGSFASTMRQDGACSCTFDVSGFEPVTGTEVIIRDGGTGTDETTGRVLSRTRILTVDQLGTRATERPVYRVTSSDQWFLDRFSRVTASYTDAAVTAIVSDIISSYTDGGFAIGHISSGLGTLSIEFEDVLVSEALHRVAQAAEAHMRINPYAQHIDIVTAVTDGHPITLDNTATDFWGFVYSEDISQVRTRVTVIGGGSQSTAVAATSATTIAVDELRWYDASGGTVTAGSETVTYTGKDMGSGPGNLTGCSGISRDIPQGTPIRVTTTVDDATAQTNLATKLGGGASGIAVHVIDDDTLTDGEAAARAAEDLALYKDPIPAIGYSTRSPFVTPGKKVTVSMTTPRSLSATVTISEVAVTIRGLIQGETVDYDYRISASPDELTFGDFLRQQVE